MTSFLNFFTQKSVKLASNWSATNYGVDWSGDINGDGKYDLIVTGASYPNNGNIDQQGYVLFGDGQGNFSVAPNNIFPSQSLKTVHPREIIIDDFNKDGRADIYVASHGYDTNPFPGEQNKLFLSRSDGTWSDETSTLPSILDFSHNASAGDINGDGFRDIFVGNIGGGTGNPGPYVLLNDGTGHFTKSEAVIPASQGQPLNLNYNTYTTSMLVDLNNDGKVELVLGSTGGSNSPNGSKILWNTGSGYDNTNISNFPAGRQMDPNFITQDLVYLDLNKDGFNDILALSTSNNPFYQGTFIDAYLNKNGNSFEKATDLAIGPAASHPTGAWSIFFRKMDVNNDGLEDITLSEYIGTTGADTNSVFLLLNKGNGSFHPVKYGDITSNQTALAYNAITVKTVDGIGFISPFSMNGDLLANETILIKQLPKFAYGTAEADFQGTRSQYKVSDTGNTVTVTDTVSSRDGSQTLLDIQERVKFSDGVLAFDINNTADNALMYRLYQASFARTPDEGGLRYWIDTHNKGLSINDIGSQFLNSAEFKQKYGANPTNSQLVDLLYKNILGREGESGGVKYWNGVLESGQVTKETVLIGFAGSPENVTKTAANIDNGFWVL